MEGGAALCLASQHIRHYDLRRYLVLPRKLFATCVQPEQSAPASPYNIGVILGEFVVTWCNAQ